MPRRYFMDFSVDGEPKGRIVVEFPCLWWDGSHKAMAGYQKTLNEAENGFKIELDDNGWPIRIKQSSDVILIYKKSIFDSNAENEYGKPWNLANSLCSEPSAQLFAFTQNQYFGEPCLVVGEVVEGNEHIWYLKSISSYKSTETDKKLRVLKHGDWYSDTEPFNAANYKEAQVEVESAEKVQFGIANAEEAGVEVANVEKPGVGIADVEEAGVAPKQPEVVPEEMEIVPEKKKRGRKPKATKAVSSSASEVASSSAPSAAPKSAPRATRRAASTVAPEPASQAVPRTTRKAAAKTAPKPIVKKPVGRPRKNANN